MMEYGSPSPGLDFGSLASPLRELAISAAVRERFRPADLLQNWIQQNGERASDAMVSKALDICLSLAAVSESSSSASDTYQLPLDLRREVLEKTELGAVQAALAGLTTKTLTEQSFASLIAGPVSDPSEMGRGELLALASGAAWARGLKGVRQIAADDIERRIRDQEFVERVGGADLSQFVGRASLLRALAQLWTLPRRPTVLIEGPGGIGKTIAVARFFQNLLSPDQSLPRPDAIFHIDCDLPEFQRSSYVTIATEIVRQLALRWAPNANENLLSLLRTFGGLRDQRPTTGKRASFSIESTRDYRSHFSRSSLLEEAFGIFAADRDPALRLILFVDSFERVENLDELASTSVADVAADLRSLGADVMLIYAARAYRDTASLDPDSRPSVQRVPRFRQAEAIDYLISKAARRGIKLSRMDADRANRSINGWPLGLRLAVSMLGTKHNDFDLEGWLAAIDGGGRSLDATLYERLLDRIVNEDLRKLAKPGLLVRRVTAKVIEAVLAEPCELESRLSGRDLMLLAQDEGQLFQHDPSDPEALWHRQDLREIMLPALRKAIPEEVARKIHDNAVAFYAPMVGEVARAEELYHRLARGDDRAEITARWTEAAGVRLIGALGELPPRSAALLRLLLGGGRTDAARDTFEADLQLDEFRAVAFNRLNEGITEIGDIFAAAGVPAAIASPLGDVQAQLMLRQGQHAELIDGAAALPGNQSVPSPVKARVYMTAAALCEGQGDAVRAQEFWYLAQRLSARLTPAEQLSVRIALARVSRLTGFKIRARRQHVFEACDLLVAQESEIRSNRVVKLEAVAELSEVLKWPEIRLQMIDARIAEVLVVLFRDLSPLFPSALSDSERLAQLAIILGENPAYVHTPYELDKLMQYLFNGRSREEHARAVEALRSEVDSAFAAAARRTVLGQSLTSVNSLAYS